MTLSVEYTNEQDGLNRVRFNSCFQDAGLESRLKQTGQFFFTYKTFPILQSPTVLTSDVVQPEVLKEL
jgi:hypothetical protein